MGTRKINKRSIVMTLNEFISKYNGKKWDWDGVYGAQCFDLFQFYNRDMFGGGFVSGNGAVDIWSTYPTNIYTKIPNSPTGYPLPGDVMIWGTNYGPWGHVAIVTKANVDNFTCLSQNDPVGRETYLKDYPNYSGVLGWLRPNKPVVIENSNQPSMSEQDKKDIESMRKLREYNGVWYEAKNVIDDFEKLKQDRKSDCEALNIRLDAVSKDNLKLLEDIEALKKHHAIELDSELSKQRSDMLMTCSTEKNSIKDDYETRLVAAQKENPVQIVEKETALSIRFKSKPTNEKVKAIIDILLA